MGLKLAILAIMATFFNISPSNLFYPSFTLRLIGKPNKMSIGLKMTILAPKNHKKGHISIRFFFKVTQIFLTAATINVFPWLFLWLLEG